MDLRLAAPAEVIARHAFFVEWFTGRADAAAMEASARAFAPDMRMVAPDGRVMTTAQVVAMLRTAQATRAPDFQIAVVVHDLRIVGELALVVYDERQSTGGATTLRRSTALLSADAGAPEGAVWRHLHETWIADHSPHP